MSIDSNLIAELLGLLQSQVARHCFDGSCFPKSSVVSYQLSFHSKIYGFADCPVSKVFFALLPEAMI